ncbi:AfsR/SARP family transcriptional regulator [Winogradskya humida]|uniref:AfsR/SARP family transcriptional regulator n=1 Tax=Winogradskya humida TaxID=113566 RepID=UPI001EF16F6B|nr:BTAD domain-containing putative transcriptional regulator [Actinoplanes humidus]
MSLGGGAVRFGILGPLVVTDDGREIAITAGRDRTVLALLLLQPGRIVGVEELIDAVWGDDSPVTARGQLQTCVSRLRKALPWDVIRTDPAGYGIAVSPDDLDAGLFTRLTTRAGTDPERYRQALALWRGPALAGIEARAVRRLAAVLDEQRGNAVEEWIDLELTAGRERELVAELTGLVEAYPLRERLRAQLMAALHRLGRRAEALAEYRRARKILQERLGIQPGPELQDLHRRVLTGADEPAPGQAGGKTVRSLPRTVGDFTGRDETVDRLVRAAAQTTLLTVDGMAGSGKTTLALRVAELLADAYPDAQLFLDLQGHSEGRPLDPAAAVLALLRQLGVEMDRVPPGLDAQAGLWRSELARRRALVILDNAASSAQVLPLLPASPSNLVVVTSRRRLLGLDGGHPESLPVLEEAEAVALLGRIVGERVAAEPEAALDLVRRCGCLPLAIRLAGSRLAHRPRWAVHDLVGRLGESALPELAAEDRSVVNAFALSYGQLPEPDQQLFRLLGLHPADRFGAVSVAALAGLSLTRAQEVLDDLVDVNLIEEPAPNVYRLHDLVRQYAVQLAETIPLERRRVALAQLIGLHLEASTELNRRIELGVGFTGGPQPRDRPELVARAVDDPGWMEDQRPALLPLIRAAAEIGAITDGWMLARVTWRFLYERNYHDDMIAVQELGLSLAREDGDERGIATLNNSLASGYYRAGQYAQAVERLTETLTHEVRLGNATGEARARYNLGGVLQRMGRPHEALAEIQRAYDLMRARQDLFGLARCNSGLAATRLLLGRWPEALRSARHTLQAAVETGDRALAASSLVAISEARLGLGQTAQVERVLMSVLWFSRAIGFASARPEALHLLGLVELQRDHPQAATEWFLAALDDARGSGDWLTVAHAETGLGRAAWARGDNEDAVQRLGQALTTSRRIRAELEEGRALQWLGACTAASDPEAARRYLWRALAIFDRMGVPGRGEVERVLAGLDR